MKKYIPILLFCIASLAAQAQMPFSKSQLIGTWELDYGSAKGCVDGFIKPVIKQGQVLITFNDSLTYTTLTGGNLSNGYYTIDVVTNTIIFDPIHDQTGTIAPSRIKVVLVEQDQLTLLMEECGGIYEQVYNRVKIPNKK